MRTSSYSPFSYSKNLSPEQKRDYVYNFFARVKAKYEYAKRTMHPETGKQMRDSKNRIYLRFPDGTLRRTGEIYSPSPPPTPKYDRESQIILGGE